MQKLFYLPEAHTDFVFAVIAEEFGLVGSVDPDRACSVSIVWRALLIARQAAAEASAGTRPVWPSDSRSGRRHRCSSIIGVNMGILPTKGLTLPLVSYGRSSIIVTLIGFGLLLRIDRENRMRQRRAGGAAAERRVGA